MKKVHIIIIVVSIAVALTAAYFIWQFFPGRIVTISRSKAAAIMRDDADCHTTGAVIFARTETSYKQLKKLFLGRSFPTFPSPSWIAVTPLSPQTCGTACIVDAKSGSLKKTALFCVEDGI